MKEGQEDPKIRKSHIDSLAKEMHLKFIELDISVSEFIIVIAMMQSMVAVNLNKELRSKFVSSIAKLTLQFTEITESKNAKHKLVKSAAKTTKDILDKMIK